MCVTLLGPSPREKIAVFPGSCQTLLFFVCLMPYVTHFSWFSFVSNSTKTHHFSRKKRHTTPQMPISVNGPVTRMHDNIKVDNIKTTSTGIHHNWLVLMKLQINTWKRDLSSLGLKPRGCSLHISRQHNAHKGAPKLAPRVSLQDHDIKQTNEFENFREKISSQEKACCPTSHSTVLVIWTGIRTRFNFFIPAWFQNFMVSKLVFPMQCLVFHAPQTPIFKLVWAKCEIFIRSCGPSWNLSCLMT